jgi:hypothetical protein
MRASVLLIGVALAACGVTAPTAGVDAMPPERPAVPATWSSIVSEAGDAELVVPPDLADGVVDASSGILVQGDFDGRVTPLQVSAYGRSALPDQPAAGESVRSWLERGS